MNRNLIIAAVLILLVIGGISVMRNNQTVPADLTDGNMEVTTGDSPSGVTGQPAEDSAMVAQEDSGQEAVKTFDLKASNFKYDVTEIRVKSGDKVRINLEVTQGFHDFVVDEFTAKTAQIGEGKTDSVEFIADKKGIYEFYCSVGSHRKMGMVGKLIVE